ncbi:MAG: M3 family oligoendopeptidase, partial [Verrucomicrobium sp.]|nr:M3 family oligoendopeptidase [Verrucomicrobium sp.]
KIVNVQVPFEGKQWTFKALAQVQEDPDRARRQAAWEAVRAARAGIAEKLEDLFDQQLKVRDAIAKEAGFANYRDYIFVEKGRFDYKPEDTLAFHEQVERHVVPFLRELQRERKEKLGVETLRPWDTKIDVQGDQPLRPFQTSEELFEGVRDIFSKLDPELGERFAEMKKTGLLDLENRPGKAPGAYSQVLAETGWPFTFMSAVGTQSDVTTLIHEGGHDQQAIATRDQRLFYYMLEAGMFIEFAEVASMGMEQLAVPHLDRFYGPEDARRAKLSMVERPVEVLPWIAAIDSFQQWAYTNVDEALDHKKRREKWGELTERFGGGEDWSGYEDRRTGLWLDQPHVFVHPLYYVEYAYAQDGALQILQNSLKDPEKAVRDYRAGIALGSSKPLPELFEATGIRFDKRGEMLESIMGSLREARVAMLPQAAPRKELGGLDFQRSAVAAPIETPQRKLDKV